MDDIESFYRQHARAVFAFLLSLSRDRTLAEDLTQDTFVKATRSLRGFRGGDPRAWLFTIARSVFIDHTRRRRPIPVDLDDRHPSPSGPDIEERQMIDAVLHGLPDRQRMALLLVDQAGMSYADMAAVVGVSPDAAKGLLHRARRNFRTAYQEMNP
ncbi:MAG TPA: sigma-70 family RNA polymerase sigma factor [Acidimicrobiia bacterium]|nr:sigma-70 family RNA polymerase sigma factor [Acidimicrobiia bacterium]